MRTVRMELDRRAAGRAFNTLWVSRTASEVGGGILLLTLPLLATERLLASAFQLSALQAANSAAFLFAALPLGVLLRKWRPQNAMLVSDSVRICVVVGAVLVQLSGNSNVATLCAVAILVGVCTVAYETAGQTMLPLVLRNAQLLDGNGKFSASYGVSLIAGPLVGGLLIAVLGYSAALLSASFCFMVSLLGLVLVRRMLPRASAAAGDDSPAARFTARALGDGFAYIRRYADLKGMVAGVAAVNFFAQSIFAVEVLFLVRVLEVPAALVAVPFSLAALGSVLAGLSVSRLSAAIGTARILWLAPTTCLPLMLLIPAAFPGAGVLLYMVGITSYFAASAVMGAGLNALLQAVTPPALLTSVVSTSRFVTWGVMPLGALCGGLLATTTSIRTTLLLGASGCVLSTLFILASPLRTLRDVDNAMRPQVER